ncbi:secretory lipase family protein [Mycobacterium intracellulare 1956]|uniref:Secretory lipase family protein n=1 Tax=Mycobacterium intracellulare 1956 TaxID=1299331 RepID=X8CFC6_MYCIT|nr:secretory lipase family protein [Mycobacterium intracellulare 1956]
MFNQGIHYSGGWDIMFNYEELFVATMVARGFAIVMTDYEGLGTAPMHTYVGRVAEGQAVLDAARAAMRLPGTSLDPHGPVAFWGYSQGGGATASAAELASQYAPDLHIVGTYAGRHPPTSRSCCPMPTAARWSASSGTRSTASWPPIPSSPTSFAPR